MGHCVFIRWPFVHSQRGRKCLRWLCAGLHPGSSLRGVSFILPLTVKQTFSSFFPFFPRASRLFGCSTRSADSSIQIALANSERTMPKEALKVPRANVRCPKPSEKAAQESPSPSPRPRGGRARLTSGLPSTLCTCRRADAAAGPLPSAFSIVVTAIPPGL